MKNLISKLKAKFRRKSPFEKRHGVSLDHFLEEGGEGLVFNMRAFMEFVEDSDVKHHDLMEALNLIQKMQLRCNL